MSTGKVWEDALTKAAHEFLGTTADEKGGGSENMKFAGCETTGLNATELHDRPSDEVNARMTDATKRLVRRGQEQGAGARPVQSICLGCAGMVGLDDAVRRGCIEVLGQADGRNVRVIDGVKAGVGVLFGLATGGF